MPGTQSAPESAFRVAHGIFEELGGEDLIRRIRAHGARPLRAGGNRPPGALVAFREKPPGLAVRGIVHERPARLVPGFLLAPELPEDTRVREARRDGAVAVLDRVVPGVLGVLERPVLLQEGRAVIRDGIRIGKALRSPTSNALRASSMRPDSSSVFARPQFPFS